MSRPWRREARHYHGFDIVRNRCRADPGWNLPTVRPPACQHADERGQQRFLERSVAVAGIEYVGTLRMGHRFKRCECSSHRGRTRCDEEVFGDDLAGTGPSATREKGGKTIRTIRRAGLALAAGLAT